ncbi:ribonuclease III [Lichtheimia hyalospora FSU 10163]|nr:ribonuclease III [Lichtheimia hyalospora FSU 10163]
MFRALSRVHTSTSTCFRATRAFHARSVVRQEAVAPKIDSALSAFGARIGLQSLNPAVLEQAVTHSSVEENKGNQDLVHLGKRATGLFVTEYYHSKYPNMHMEGLNKVIQSHLVYKSVSKVGAQLGLQDVMRWDRSTVQTVALGECLYALIGAVYKEQGFDAAKQLVHAHILSRDLDVRPLVKFDEPKRYLSALTRKLGKEAPVSRLLSETGRHSSAPVYVIGVFSGETKLGEGFGSSLKMAEFRACQDALIGYYGKEEKDFMLPSDASHVDNYKPPVLGTTEAIV